MEFLRRRTGVVLGAMLAFLAPVAWAQSVTVEVGGTAISLVAPEGHCFLDKTNEADKRLMSIIERSVRGINRLLVAFADCGEINFWRSGQQPTLNNYGYAMVPIKAQRVPLSRQEFLSRLATFLEEKEGRDKFEGGLSLGAERLEKMRNAGDIGEEFRVGETKFLGLMFRDENALCVGTVMRVTTEFGKQKTLLGCSLITVLRNRMVSLYIYGPNDAESVELLMSSSRELAARNVAINER